MVVSQPDAAALLGAAPVAQADMSRGGGGSSAVQAMTVGDVALQLKELGLGAHVEAFENGGVDGAMLNIVDEDTLKELGMSSGLERKKLLAWLSKQ